MLQPGEQAVLHTALAASVTGLLAVSVRLVARLSRRAELELASDPRPTGSRAWRLELLAGLHTKE
jgi:hypothetical protein